MAVAFVAQSLTGLGQVQRLRLGPLRFGHRLAHQGDQVALHLRREIEAADRGIFDPQMHEDRDGRVIAGDAQRFQIGQRLVQRASRQAASAGQIVGRDTLIR